VARPEQPGHAPRAVVDPDRGRGRTVTPQLSAGELAKVCYELAACRDFAELSASIVAVNEAICEARPPLPLEAARQSTYRPGRPAKKGLFGTLGEAFAALRT
jgi:hypothetical protein